MPPEKRVYPFKQIAASTSIIYLDSVPQLCQDQEKGEVIGMIAFLPYLWMFVPLAAAFIGLTVAIVDLKHGTEQTDTCQYVGRGHAIQAFKAEAQELYRRSGKPEDDIALSCKALGKVTFNDDAPLPAQLGQPVQVTVRDYHYFPTRYYVELPVIDAPTEN